MNSMNNIAIYNNFNDKTKKYLNYLFSWLDYFKTNHLTLPILDNDEIISEFNIEDDEDILIISAFLSLLSYDNDINDLFKKHNITLDNITKFCKEKIEFKEDSTETISFDTFDLTNLMNKIIERISFNLLDDKQKISLNDLEPYQIFDYLLNSGSYETLEDLLYLELNIVGNLFSTEAFSEYQDYASLLDKDFAACYGCDGTRDYDDIKTIEIGDFELTYDNGEVYLILSNGEPNKEINVIGNGDKITIDSATKVYKINDRIVNKSVFEEFCNSIDNSYIIGLTIFDSKTESFKSFHAYKDDIFGVEKPKESNDNKTNNSLGTDITNQPFLKNPAMGREKELDEIETILLYPEKDRSIIITGPGGTGKTSLVKGLCYRIQNGLINKKLKNLRIINVDITDCVAGSKYVGVLEEKLKKIFEQAKGDKNTLICIEEIHRAMGAGKTEGDDNSIAQILKQYLDFGDLRIIGTTTTDEYIEYIEPDTAFKSRFEKLEIKEPKEEVLFQIINDLITTYDKMEDTPTSNLNEEEKRILIQKLIEGTRLHARHYQDRENNPRLLVNIIKRAYAIASFKGQDEVTIEDFVNSYTSNDRLYDSARNTNGRRIIEALKKKDDKQTSVILQFKPKSFL